MQSLGYTSAKASLATIQAVPLFPLILERRQLRSEAWLPFVGYIREQPFRSASITAAEQAITRLQNQIGSVTTK